MWSVFYDQKEPELLPKYSARELRQFESKILADGFSFLKIDKIRVYFVGSQDYLNRIMEVLHGSKA